MKSTHKCLLNVWTTPWVGQTKLQGNHSLEKYKGKPLHAKKGEKSLPGKKSVIKLLKGANILRTSQTEN